VAAGVLDMQLDWSVRLSVCLSVYVEDRSEELGSAETELSVAACVLVCIAYSIKT